MKSVLNGLLGFYLLVLGHLCVAASEQHGYNDNALIPALKAAPVEPTVIYETKRPEVRDEQFEPGMLARAVLAIDQNSGAVLFEKNADNEQSIASITKLMTAIVVLDSDQSLEQTLLVAAADATLARPTRSRLKVGARLTRGELMRLMLMASDNRAAATLARNHPGGVTNFVKKMNEAALQLGLFSTRFSDPTGLNPSNISTARELAMLVKHAYGYDAIRAYSTTPEYVIPIGRAKKTLFQNTNRLTRSDDWQIGLSKTGTITASGQCLVLQAAVAGRSLVMVILDSWGKGGRIEDAIRLRHWLEGNKGRMVVAGI